MLRKNLQLTTAFFVAATVSSLAAPTAGPGAGALRHDSNHEFMQTYCKGGYFTVSDKFFERSSQNASSAWEHVAVPVMGKGQTVTGIIVDEGYKYASANGFSAAIYSAAPSGYPGQLIAGGTAQGKSRCGKITIPITSTTLASKVKYWIEETVPRAESSDRVMYWKLAPHAKHRAYAQIHQWKV